MPDAPHLASYIRPDDRAVIEGDTDNIHANEGTTWAIERVEQRDTGEVFDVCHVVHVHHGTLRFGRLRADQVGSVSPPAPADLDSLIRLAGKHLKEHGRRSDDRYFAVVQVCRHALSLPAYQPDMPSVFGDGDPAVRCPDCAHLWGDHDDEGCTLIACGCTEPARLTPARAVCGTCGRPLGDDGACTKHGTPVAALDFDPDCPRCDHNDHRCPGCGVDVLHNQVACDECNDRVRQEDRPDPAAALLARLRALGHVEHNEVLRQARTDGLVYLEDGAVLALADVVAYDVLLTRWERHTARTGRVAS